jgi:hypothetical protein
MKTIAHSGFWSAALLAMPLSTQAQTLSGMDEVGAAIIACWKAPTGVKKSAVTLRFGFKHDGSLLGQPRATSINVTGDATTRKQFVAAAIDAVVGCTPVKLSPTLAKGIGGQVFTMEFATPDR